MTIEDLKAMKDAKKYPMNESDFCEEPDIYYMTEIAEISTKKNLAEKTLAYVAGKGKDTRDREVIYYSDKIQIRPPLY